MQKNKISFIIPTLKAGGAERVMSFVAQNLNKNKFDVTLVVVGNKTNTSYDVKGVNIFFLEKPRVLFSFFAIYRYLKKNKPDVVISAIGHLNILMAFESIWFKKIKFIGREVNVLSVLKDIQPSPKERLTYQIY